MEIIKMKIIYALFVLSLFTFAGCGSSGGSSSPALPSTSTQSSSATVSYFISNDSTSPLTGIQFNTYLPTGVTVATEQGTKNVKSTSLVAGNGLVVFATYSAPMLKLGLMPMPKDATTLQKALPSEILKITYQLDSDKITDANFRGANKNSPIPKNEMVGYSYNLISKETIDITPSITPTFTVAFANYSGSSK